MKAALKSRLGDDWQARARRLNRLRWVTKLRILRHYGVDLAAHPAASARYVLVDPEVESYTYDLDNEGQLVAWAVEGLGVDAGEAAAWIDETKDDPELNSELARRLRWRLDVKSRPGLGPRLLWHVLVRARRPELIVETGILEGLGSLVLLRALERNRREGSPGRLVSFDVRSEAGGLVPAHLRDGWERHIASTDVALEPALAGREVGMLVHDTPHTEAIQRLEFGIALARAAPRLTLVDCSGGQLPTLERMAREHGGRYHHFQDRPRNHFYPSRGNGVALFDRGSTG